MVSGNGGAPVDSASAIAAIRAALNSAENAVTTDDTIARFLRADKGIISTATSRLKDTIAWREQERPETLGCSLCRQQPGSHYMHPVGFDRHNQPVLYSCISLASDRTLNGNREHMIMTFEQAVKLMKPGVEKWVWFSDCHGFGFRDLNPTLGKAFLELASKHYPERLACFVLCATPSIFQGLYNMLVPLMDPVTKAKIRLIPYDIDKEAKKPGSSKLKHFMDEMFPAETSEWIYHEMAENRVREVQASKKYCQSEVHAAVKAGAPLKKHWGSTEMLQQMSEKPDLLLPNAAHSVAPTDAC